MQFDWTINLGQLLTIAALLIVAVKFGYQHQLMWRDYESRYGMKGDRKLCAAHDHCRTGEPATRPHHRHTDLTQG